MLIIRPVGESVGLAVNSRTDSVRVISGWRITLKNGRAETVNPATPPKPSLSPVTRMDGQRPLRKTSLMPGELPGAGWVETLNCRPRRNVQSFRKLIRAVPDGAACHGITWSGHAGSIIDTVA